MGNLQRITLNQQKKHQCDWKKKDKETTSLKLSKEKEPTNPTPESSDKIATTSPKQTSPKQTAKQTSPTQTKQTAQTVQETNNIATQSQDVDFFSDMTPQYVAPKKIQIQPKPQPAPQPATKIKIDLESANKPENMDAVGWDEEEIQIEASADIDLDDDSTPTKTQPKRERKQKTTKEPKQKPPRLAAVKVKSNETFDDDFEEESHPDRANV